MNDNNKLNFEEQQLRTLMSNNELKEDQKIKMMSEAYTKVSRYTMQTMANNIHSIETPNATVTDNEYILDYLKNCDKSIYEKIKDHIVSQRKVSEIKPLQIVCDNIECKHKFEQPFTLDMTTFFE